MNPQMQMCIHVCIPIHMYTCHIVNSYIFIQSNQHFPLQIRDDHINIPYRNRNTISFHTIPLQFHQKSMKKTPEIHGFYGRTPVEPRLVAAWVAAEWPAAAAAPLRARAGCAAARHWGPGSYGHGYEL